VKQPPWIPAHTHGTASSTATISRRAISSTVVRSFFPQPLDEAIFSWQERDVIVMTQTCDLVPGREKVTEVLLCAAWSRSDLMSGHLATPRGLEDARRGNLPGYHLLAASDFNSRELRVVDFRRVYSLPLTFVRQRAARTGERLRLLPPYREHLSQAFARYFMRVGLPQDIPPFRANP
jgi:hypothetical protein